MNELEQVKEFSKEFGYLVAKKPSFPDAKTIKLRIDLMREELNEIEEAINNKDLPNLLKEFADLDYVLKGSILSFGLGDIYTKGFKEVHRSNMSKTCDTIEEARQTAIFYQREKKLPTDIIENKNTGTFSVINQKTKKLVKSKSYTEANMSTFFNCKSMEMYP